MENKAILLSGLPRSGTTWVGEVLTKHLDVNYIYEPDNEKINSYACQYKSELHRFPYLTKNDCQPLYLELWESAIKGNLNSGFDKLVFKLFTRSKIKNLEANLGCKTGYVYVDEAMKDVSQNASMLSFDVNNKWFKMVSNYIVNKPVFENEKLTVIKSVHSPLALEWLEHNLKMQVVIILRNPYALYASYIRLNMPDAFRNVLQQPAVYDLVNSKWNISKTPSKGFPEEAAYQIALVYRLLFEQLKQHKSWLFLSHDRLCKDPVIEFKSLFQKLDLLWTTDVENTLTELNQKGEGFTSKRVSKDQPDKWKKELNINEVSYIEAWIDEFEINNFIKEYIL